MARLLRMLWRFRGALATGRSGFTGEIATALDTLIRSNPVTRAGMRGYRLAILVLIIFAITEAAVGLAVAITFGDTTFGLVIGAVLIVGALVTGWQAWIWAAGLRFLREHADPARRVPMSELPSRLKSLADEAAATSAPLAEALRGVAREASAAPTKGPV
jgi:hypothetical protein